MFVRLFGARALFFAAVTFCSVSCFGQPARASSHGTAAAKQNSSARSNHPVTAKQAAEIESGPWVLSNTTYNPLDFTQQPFVGNGYLGLRIPAIGQGYQGGNLGESGFPLFNPRYTSALVAGVYENAIRPNKFQKNGPSDYISSLPTWSEMDLTVDGQTLNSSVPPGQISDYRQSVNMRAAIVTTSFLWTPAPGKALDVTYEVLANRTRFSGQLTLTGLLNGKGAERIRATSRKVDTATDISTVALQTPGRNTVAVEKQLLVAGPGLTIASRSALAPAQDNATAGEQWTLTVSAGKTYRVIKYVGISTSNDPGAPKAVAATTVRQASHAGWPALFNAHRFAWDQLWQHNIATPRENKLQASVNGSFYLLYSSIRAGLAWSIPPAGLTSDNYAGEIFWDADTWMYPTLLAFHPELAKSVVDFRYDTRHAAEANAALSGYRGGQWAWDDGPTGACGGLAPCKHYEDHLQSDIALAQWQYYEATGDRQWLVQRGYPVIKDVADFWASRVTREADGKYHILKVTGPDEFTAGVNDESATNAGAIVALRIAVDAAKAAGQSPDPQWAKIAANIFVAVDPDGTHPEYVGYKNETAKQADTVLMTYPFQYVTDPAVAAADLRRYMAVTDPGGPAMTSSVEAIIAAQVRHPGSLDFKLLQESYLPFVRGAYDQFLETRYLYPSAHQGPPTFTFATGAGGFLQIFPYGFAGLRWNPSAITLAPTLPLQLSPGITMRGIRYHGRSLTIAVGPRETTVTLTSGAPVALATPAGTLTVRHDHPVQLKTDRTTLH
jgi:trehalose/maltose hydrolase-like predicted phosphorylase